MLDNLKTHADAICEDNLETARGFMIAEGSRVSLAVSRRVGPYDLLWRAFDDAVDVESRR